MLLSVVVLVVAILWNVLNAIRVRAHTFNCQKCLFVFAAQICTLQIVIWSFLLMSTRYRNGNKIESTHEHAHIQSASE